VAVLTNEELKLYTVSALLIGIGPYVPKLKLNSTPIMVHAA
jgi:hypothetical protein